MTDFHESIPIMRRWISKLWIIPLLLFQCPELLAHVRLPESPLLVAEYKYDGLGNLLQINETGAIRRLVRDRVDELARPLLLTDASGAAVQTYVWANSSLIAQVEPGAVRYAHFNELGHLLALTDESGDVTDEFAYHPYGRLVAHIGTTETPFAYMGAYGVMRAGYDLYLTKHRAYSSNLRRFLQADPMGLEGGWNLYAYAGGNPVSLIDVLGLSSEGPRTWLTQAPVQSSVYSGATLRDPTQSAVPYYTDAWLLGSSLNSATPAGQAMAFSQAAGYLTAPGGEMLAGVIGSAASRIISKAVTPVARSGGIGVQGIANEVPSTLARIVPGSTAPVNLGRSGAADVFVTAADDIAGMNAAQIQQRLAIKPSSSYTIIEFPTPNTGLASPINRLDPGFVGGGRTAGGAREFVLPNGVIPSGSTIMRVP